MYSTDRFQNAGIAHSNAIVELNRYQSSSSQGTWSMRHVVLGVIGGAALGMAMSLAIATNGPGTADSNLLATSIHRSLHRSVVASALGDATVQALDLPPMIAATQVDSKDMRAQDLPMAPPLTSSAWSYTQQRHSAASVRSMAGWAVALAGVVLGAWALLVRRRQGGLQPLMQAVPVQERGRSDGDQSLGASRRQLVYEFNSELPKSKSALEATALKYPATLKTMGMRQKQPTDFVAETLLPTTSGDYRVRSYKHSLDGLTYTDPIAIICGNPEGVECVPVRVHDACWTSEVIGSLKCDCAQQLAQAMDYIRDEGCGIVIYLHQEGRGIGLANKIAAYAVQETGADTVEANRLLGLPDDSREYTAVRDILMDLGVKSVGLMTNNPRKVRELQSLGIEVDKRIACIVDDPGAIAAAYVQAKREQMGHFASDEEDVDVISENAP